MLAEFVVFTSVVEFLIIAMYIGGIPMAEHDNLPCGKSRTTEAGNTTFGETNGRKVQMRQNLKAQTESTCNNACNNAIYIEHISKMPENERMGENEVSQL